MDFVSPIITPIVQSLLVPIKKHLGFLISSTNYVKKMDAKMKQLKDTAQEVQATWDMAVGNTEVVPERVEPWLQDVKSLNERCNLIEAVGCFNIAKRYKVGKQSYDILEEIKDLENRESKIVFTHAQKPLAEIGSTSTGPSTSAPVSMGTESNFESRDLIFKHALQALQSNNESQKMIALCGMGGVGKTTMMERLKKVVEESNIFEWVVKVVIGKNTDIISLQQVVAQYVGKDLTEINVDARADRLHKIFEVNSQQGKKKTLVIMDDLWSEIDLTMVGLSPLPNGFKLLITSRFEDVCTRMGVRTHSLFKVGVLSVTEAKTLFFRYAEPCPSDDDDAELQRIGEEIVLKCGGLPIAIITIAKALSGKMKNYWREALSNLQHHDLQDLDEIVYKVFEMSYDNLRKDDDKAVFLLSGLFPDDFDISIEDLMKYGWGLKLFTGVHTLAQARRRADICVSNLMRANLLIESDHEGCVKMHDLVRAFVLSNFSKVKQASIVDHDDMSVQGLRKYANESYERILLKCTNMCEVPRDFNYSNLSLMILMDGNKLKFPEDVYEGMEKLKVMSCENLGIPLLPVMLEHFIKLQTLCLRSCFLEDGDLSFFGSLRNLEILSLVDCDIRRLPSTIGKLNKLKLLDLTGCINLYIDDGVIQNLESLEELYMRACEGRHVRFTQANCGELEKLSKHLFALELEFFDNMLQLKNMSFKNLERFKISIGCRLNNYERHSFTNTLRVFTDCNELQESNIGDLFEKTEELQLQVKNMNHLEDVSMHHTFSQLRVLNVSKCADLTYLFTFTVASGLKKLEQLIISQCPILRTIVGDTNGVGVTTFQKLKFLSLESLPKMVTLCDNVMELPSLVELKAVGLPNFTSIYSKDNNKTSVMQPLLNREVIIPKLEKLYISMMVNLKQIWPCEISPIEKNNVSTLSHIKVRECDSLINLFPSNPLPLLNHLEELVVEWCGSIEVLFNIDFERVCGMEEYNSKLRKIEVGYLGNLKELWRMRGVNNSNIFINGFKGVQSIEINYCNKFIDVFTPTTANFNLGALSTYSARQIDCDVEERYTKDMLRVKREQEVNVTYPSYLLHTCDHLQRLELVIDKRVDEVVFEMDSPSSSRQLTTTQDGQQPLLLPYLEVLRLYYLKEMSHVWRCNWNKFFIRQRQHSQFPFQNLTQITLEGCHKIKYLFSPLMAKYLSNLKKLYIDSCDGIEEVISSREDENEENITSTSSLQNITLFPHLDTLELKLLSNLKSIDDDDKTKSGQAIGARWSFCQYPTKIDINGCGALSVLIPWYALGEMRRLQELKIQGCRKMVEVFESESGTNSFDEGSVCGTTLIISTLNNITALVAPQLSNLKSVLIMDCDLLQHIFTFSALKSLKQLKELAVIRCKATKVIVKEEKVTHTKHVVFPRLERLKLINLPNLEGFFLGTNDLYWPLLVDVMISDCPQLLMFTHGESKTPKLKYIRTSFGKYSLDQYGLNLRRTTHQSAFPTCAISSGLTFSEDMPWSFHNLIEIYVEYYKYVKTKTIIPSNVLVQLEKLEKICLRYQPSVEAVFEVVASEGNKSQTIVQIPNLREMNLKRVDLKYLWNSNQRMILEFPNLTTLSVDRCNRLKHVFTCSMVGGLMQLQYLEIFECNSIEVIVKKEDEKGYCDGKVNEIMGLPRLKSITLYDLERLEGFCIGRETFSLPALDTLEIKNCPALTVFTNGDLSTPKLKVVDTDYGMCVVRGGLNSFIETSQGEKISSYED